MFEVGGEYAHKERAKSKDEAEQKDPGSVILVGDNKDVGEAESIKSAEGGSSQLEAREGDDGWGSKDLLTFDQGEEG